jgi:hypothetical protein
MGMIGNYLRVTKDELQSYLSDSNLLNNRIYDHENQNDKNLIDVDKSWEGLFFLLTGKSLATFEEASTPLLWILIPPQEIDSDQDMGYGPATYTTIEQTKELNNALNTISIDEIRDKYNGNLMMEMGIYPEAWDNDESLEYLVESFNTVKDFYNKAAADNQAVIIFLT